MASSPLPTSSAAILVVEDSRSLAELVRSSLVEVGYTVEVAGTFRAACELVDSRKFAAAVLDLTLPDAAGGEIVDYIAAAAIPSIVFTGTFDAETRDRIMVKEVFDYLVKDNPNAVNMLIYSIQRLFINQQTKLLIVDDSATARAYIRKMIRRYRFILVEADSGAAALAQLEAHPEVRLVIADYAMPGMDGFELVSKIRERRSREQLAIIGISADRTSLMAAKFLKRGGQRLSRQTVFPGGVLQSGSAQSGDDRELCGRQRAGEPPRLPRRAEEQVSRDRRPRSAQSAELGAWLQRDPAHRPGESALRRAP